MIFSDFGIRYGCYIIFLFSSNQSFGPFSMSYGFKSIFKALKPIILTHTINCLFDFLFSIIIIIFSFCSLQFVSHMTFLTLFESLYLLCI